MKNIFLHNFQEESLPLNSNHTSSATQTLTEAREGRDQDLGVNTNFIPKPGQLSDKEEILMSTMTKTFTREEPDQDESLDTFSFIPAKSKRINLSTHSFTNTKEEPDHDHSLEKFSFVPITVESELLSTQTLTKTKEGSDLDDSCVKKYSTIPK